MQCEPEIPRADYCSVVASTCDDFPDLSAEMLTAVAERALLAIPRTFPGKSTCDTHVLDHYASLACVGHNQYTSGKAGVCAVPCPTWECLPRDSPSSRKFETIAKSYGLGTMEESWDLYLLEALMFWSLQSVVDKASSAAGRRDHQGGGKKGRSRKGHKETIKPERDTKFGRFPRDNERFFSSARDYTKADSQYAD